MNSVWYCPDTGSHANRRMNHRMFCGMYWLALVRIEASTDVVQGSHAKEFGRMAIAKDASNFEGFHKRLAPPQLANTLRSSSDYVTIEQHDADLVHLRLAAAVASGRSTGEPLELDNAVLDVLNGAQGYPVNPTRADESSDGRYMLASVDGQALGADGAALQAAVTERARVDEVMASALQLMLWDEGVG